MEAQKTKVQTGWLNKTIGELCNFSNGNGFRPPDWSKEGLPIIRIQNLNGSQDFNYYNGIPDESWLVEPGTILFAWAGTRGVSFGPTIWNGPRGVLNQHIYRIHPHKGVNPQWLYRALEIATKNIEQNAHGFKATLLHVRKEEITSQVIPVPPLPEQHAIATALSDVDALIMSLDKLIAKKRDIKQATMQQLLTGKRRLPEFSGKWKMKKLKEIGVTYGGLSGKSKEDFVNGKNPYIPFLNIMKNPIIDTDHLDYVNIGSSESQNKVIKGDLLFNGSSETPDEVGMCSVLNKDIPNLYLNSFCFGFRLNRELDTNALYLSYYFRSSVGRKLFYSLAQGATRYNLSKSSFLEIEFPYPELAEQTAIATILSDMDAEISALEQRREKTRALKQAMMQELLTGKTRLLHEYYRAEGTSHAESGDPVLQEGTGVQVSGELGRTPEQSQYRAESAVDPLSQAAGI
jgi:type I restriction enzyme S subunit